MIIKASQRSGGKQLGIHLLKTQENEHVEIHEGSSQDLGNSCTNVVGLPLRRAEF
jgi:hypothetical protein